VPQPNPSANFDELPLFVYGTLRVGRGNYRRLLAGKTLRVVPATLLDHALYIAAYPYYPYVTAAENGGFVVGDLFTLRPAIYAELLTALDALEGFRPDDPEGSAYLRVRRTVRYVDADGKPRTAEAWVYCAGQQLRAAATEERRVPSGDWVAHQRARRR
jgi:gamma-glutamylcyclotransferase (GGCT)/AIG2-like uncharacterized protein YtfP